MPLAPGRSKKAVSGNIGEMMHSWKETGRIGHARPMTKKQALAMAAAAAYQHAGLEKDEKPKKKRKAKKKAE